MEWLLLPLAPFLALGLWGSLILVFVFGFFVIMTEANRPGGAVLAAVVALTALWFFGIADVPRWVWNNPWPAFKWTVLYLFVGVLWSGFKWYKFNREKITEYQEAKVRYPGNATRTEPDPSGELYPNGNRKMIEVDTDEPKIKKEDYIPEKLAHTHAFFNWIILWWASMFWYVFSDLLADFVDFVIRRFGFYYDWIQGLIWKDVQ